MEVIKRVLCLSLLLAVALSFEYDTIDNDKFLKLKIPLPVDSELLSFSQETQSLGNTTVLSHASCYWIKDFNLFDLTPLNRVDDKILNNTVSIINAHFCADTKQSCNGVSSQMIWTSKLDPKNCKVVAGKASTLNNKWKALNNNLTIGLDIELAQGESCAEGKANYTTRLEITCDPEGQSGEISFNQESVELFNPLSCTNTLKASSKDGCIKLNYFIISYFIDEYYWLLGVVVCVIGLFLVFLGLKFLKFTFVLTSIAICTTLVLMIVEVIGTSKVYVIWIFLVVGIILGVILAYFIIHLTKLFVGGLGGYVGYILGEFLYNFIFIHVKSNPQAVYWITVVACIIICALLAICLTKHALIISTCFVGAYAVIRGASFYIGHFPDEKIVMKLINNEEWDQLKQIMDNWVYLYLIFFALFFVAGIISQYKLNKDYGKEEEANSYKKV